MQGTTIRLLRKNKLFDAITNNGYLIFIFVFLLIGLILVVVFTKLNLFSLNSKSALNDFLSYRKSGNFLSVAFNSLFAVLPYFAAIVFSGASLPGFIVVLPIVFYRAVIVGRLLYCFVDAYGLNGLLFNLIVIIVPSLLYFFALLLSAREAAGFSFSLYKSVFPGKQTNIRLMEDFKLYILRQTVIFALLIFSCLTDTVISLAFVPKFGF